MTSMCGQHERCWLDPTCARWAQCDRMAREDNHPQDWRYIGECLGGGPLYAQPHEDDTATYVRQAYRVGTSTNPFRGSVDLFVESDG